MPHNWLQQRTDYYEEVEVDPRAKDDTLTKKKKKIIQAKGLQDFNLKVNHVFELRQIQQNCCAACSIGMLWVYVLKDRLDNSKRHCRGNMQLVCLEGDHRLRGAATIPRTSPPENSSRWQPSVLKHKKLLTDKAL